MSRIHSNILPIVNRNPKNPLSKVSSQPFNPVLKAIHSIALLALWLKKYMPVINMIMYKMPGTIIHFHNLLALINWWALAYACIDMIISLSN